VLDYRQECKGQLDEDLLLHHLSKLVHTRQHGGYYRSVFELLSWFTKHEERLQKIKSPTIAMEPAPHDWPVPGITTAGGLAAFLHISVAELETLADLRCLQAQVPPGKGHHYRYRWVASKRGKHRLLEIPKKRLKTVQHTILTNILNLVPPHAAAHGFRQGRSIITNAESHLKQEVVVSFDLADFFPTVGFNRVMATFRRIGYPRTVARYLAALCTKTTPYEVWQQHPEKRSLFRERHLPQGAPTSPALANLAAYHLDLRLQYLAESQGWHYTRYADDITFSGDRSLTRTRFSLMTLIATIVEGVGFRINLKKTHVMHQSQRQEVCGVVVNEKPNVRRCDYDQLKAILRNCVKHGPASQNRQSHPCFKQHLLGRIAALSQLHANRGAKLRKIFELILW
jgi:retron-type reverse transcriptase